MRIAVGTDFGGGSLRANQLAWEVECLVDAGLEPCQALGAATWMEGELLRESTAGRLLEGGPADFFLVHGNPLEDPSELWRVAGSVRMEDAPVIAPRGSSPLGR